VTGERKESEMEKEKLAELLFESNGDWEEKNWEVRKEKAIFEEVLQAVEGESHALQEKRS